MSKLLQLRGGTTAEHASFTGAVREVTVDTTKDTLVVHDGSTAGGHALSTAADVSAALATLVDSAPATLNTLNELAAALNDDASFSTTVTDSIALKAPLASPTFTGNIAMPNGSIDLAMMNVNSVDSDQYVDGSIDRVHLAADIIDGTKIANDSIDSEHYVDASIDNSHLAASAVTGSKIAGDAIDGSKIADNAINSEHYADGSIDRAHLAADIIDGSKIDNDSINSEHYVDGSIDNQHISGMAASKLSGALPAISGASLTNLPTPSLLASPLAVGAYMVAHYHSNSTSARAAGYTFAGSLLRHKWAQPSTGNRIYPSGFDSNYNGGNSQSAGAGGTWKAMHAFRVGNWTSYWTYPIVLCQRIS